MAAVYLSNDRLQLQLIAAQACKPNNLQQVKRHNDLRTYYAVSSPANDRSGLGEQALENKPWRTSSHACNTLNGWLLQLTPPADLCSLQVVSFTPAKSQTESYILFGAHATTSSRGSACLGYFMLPKQMQEHARS